MTPAGSEHLAGGTHANPTFNTPAARRTAHEAVSDDPSS